jgi:hypothetical protein
MKARIGKISPRFLKQTYRLVRYRNERKKFVREIGIRKQQDEALTRQYDAATRKLIVFVVAGGDWETGKDAISGGIISIVSLCEETAAISERHGAATIMVTMNEGHLILKHEMFENKTPVYRFSQLSSYFKSLQEIIFHVPEFLVSIFLEGLTRKDKHWLNKITGVHVNVMNQNIRLMPEPAVIGRLRTISPKITITTAHQKYCTPEFKEIFGVPIHKFSVWISPEQYFFKKWKEKEDLIIVSPDQHPMKEMVLAKLAEVPGLTVQIIKNLTYEQYKQVISRAKWSLTFGEGLDGYLIEPVFSGAIGFAVYNEQFFTSDFKGMQTIYSSFEELNERILQHMKELDKEEEFAAYQKEEFNLCAAHYSKEQYRKNIVDFYENHYTYA